MTRTYWLLTGLALGAIAATLIAVQSERLTPGLRVAGRSFPDEFLRAAANLDLAISPSNRRKAELLRAAADEQQPHCLAESPIYWAEFKRTLESADQETAKLSEMVKFQDQLENALTKAPSISEFQLAWETWSQVDQEITTSRGRLLAAIEKDLPILVETSEADDLDAAIERTQSLASYLARHRDSIVAILAVTPPEKALPPPLQSLTRKLHVLQAATLDAVQLEVGHLRQMRKQLCENAVKIDPAKPEGGKPPEGRCSQVVRALGELAMARRQAELDSWIELDSQAKTSSEPSQGMKGATNEQMANATFVADELASSVRQLSYNLWALREIHAAETVESWVSRLAQIDTGMLEPVVGALYSSVYARRLDDVKDPEQRSLVVQQLLGGSKVPLSAF